MDRVQVTCSKQHDMFALPNGHYGAMHDSHPQKHIQGWTTYSNTEAAANGLCLHKVSV